MSALDPVVLRLQAWGRRPLGSGASGDRRRLVRQLEASQALLAAHPLVRAAAGELAAELLAGAPIDAASLDRVVDPRTSHVVVDADADQLAVLADLKRGRRLLVVLAPPGTGKSQTITNLLAGELARGSRSLFVSAKPAALEVVRRRLAAAGLAQYCAELREGEVVFGSQARAQPLPSISEEEHATLERVRTALDDYARQLHEIHWPLERSVAGVLGELAGLHAAPQLVWTPAAADLLMPEQLEELRELAVRLSRVWGVALDEGCPWRHLLDKGADAMPQAEWREVLEAAAGATAALQASSAEIARRQGWPPPGSPAETSRLLDLEALVRRGPSLPRHWLTDLDIDGARIEAEFWKQATDAYRAGHEVLRARFQPAFFELPDHALQDFEAAVALAHRLLDRKAEVLVERRAALADWLGAALKELHEWQRLAGRLASALHLRAFRGSMEGALRITRVALLLNRSERPLWNWLDQNACVKVEAALRELEGFYSRYKAARRTLLASCRESAVRLDVDALIVRFEGPWRSRLRWLHPGYHRDRHLMRAHRHDGRFPDDPLGELRKLRVFKLQQSLLEPQRKKYEALLGPFDAGPDASMAPARRALATARNVLALVSDSAELEAFAEVLREAAASAEVAALASTLETSLTQSRTLMTRIEAALPAGVVPGEEQPLLRLPFGRLGPWLEAARDAVAALLARYDAIAALSLSAPVDAPAAFEDVQDALVHLSDLRAFERRLAESAQHLRNVYGPLFTGPDSDWTAVLEALDRAEEVRSRFGPQGVPQAFLEIGPREAAAAVDPGACRELLARAEALYARLQAGFDQAHASRRHPVDGRDPWDAIAASLRSLAERIDEREAWIQYAQVRRAVEAQDLWPLLDELQSRRLPAGMLESAVRRAALEAWCDYQRAEAPALREFTRVGLEALEAQFRDLDRRHRQGAAARVVAEAEAARASRASEPVALLASPLEVLTLPDPMVFDLVIFDEACRIAPEEAVFALSRGARAVVFGDPQQLPPLLERESAPSLLSELVAAGAPVKRLCRHYGSRHEPLIAFSNALFYGGQLATLPAPTAAGGASGIRLERVTEGNQAERVATLVAEHLRRQPGSSLGVVSAGGTSTGAIERAIGRVLDREPGLRELLQGDLLDGFFVKSLEDASGDARDRIILCLGSGVAADAALAAWQLNVAVTRAREELIVVTPLVPAEIGPAAASDQLRLLRRYLDHATGGGAQPAPAARSTPLRDAVAAAARALGCGVVQPVGSGAHPLQIGVVHPQRPDRFLLGVECDDDAERAGWPARDRERLRGEALEALGWTLHRIRSPEWVANREGEIERLREALQRADQGVRAESVPVALPLAAPPPLAAPEAPPAVAPGAGETVAYQPARLSAVRLSAAFHDPRNAETLATLLRDVVAAEAPIHHDLAAQRVLAACGIGRRGKRVEQALAGALRLARERGWLEEEGVFLQAPGERPAVRVRTPAAGDAATRREALHVPHDEIRLAAALVLRSRPGLARKRLLTHVGRLFGIERLPAKARTHFQRALPDPD